MNEDVQVPEEGTEEVLRGARAQRYGAVPKVELPGDDVLLLEFAGRLARLLKNKGLYRRDTVTVIPFVEKARVEFMAVSAFRSWVERFLVCFKTRYDNDGNPYDVLRTMPTETSDGVLTSWAFWPTLPEIVDINPVPLPVWKDGQLVLQSEGYDPHTKTLTFK